MLCVSSLRLCADICLILAKAWRTSPGLRSVLTSLLSNTKTAIAVSGLPECADIPQSDESIQSKAILKILDMFFTWNRQHQLQTIHYYAISKIVDIKGLISQTQLALRYPAFKKRMNLGYTLREILLYGPKSISTILEIRIFSIARFYAYV